MSVASLQPHERFDEALAVRGYVRVPLGGDDVYQPFFQRPARWLSEYHVHLCLVGSVEERVHLAFRDYLREHSDVAAEYGALKRELAHGRGTTVEERARYCRAKAPVIAAVLRRALEEGYPRG